MSQYFAYDKIIKGNLKAFSVRLALCFPFSPDLNVLLALIYCE
jgi:hypothetical protein